MNRDKYYKLFGIKVINRTPILELTEKIIPLIYTEVGIQLSALDVNFFGQEFYDDLMKNQKIFRK